MFRNSKLTEGFRADYNYLKVDRQDRSKVEEVFGLAGIKPEILEGAEHLYYGFYRTQDLNEANNILKTSKVNTDIYQRAENLPLILNSSMD